MEPMKRYALLVIICFFHSSLVRSNTYYSQSDQDKFIYEHFFQHKKNGFFIEIGAFDGISYSNTYFFERIGWKGICIEPIPDIYQQLITHRTCLCIQGCIAAKSGQADFLIVDGPSIMLSGLLNNYDPRHLKRINEELEKYGGTKKIIKIKCFTLDEILKTYNISHIDYLSLDTEGGELEILKSINFDKTYIHIIAVENNYNDPEFQSFLKTKGYEFVVRLDGDEIYKKVNSKIMVKKIS